MNIKTTLLLLLISLLSYGQEKVVLYNGKPIRKSLLSVRFENTNQTLKYVEFEKLEPKPSGYFWINYKSIDSLLFNPSSYPKTDTLYFESRGLSFEETVISADILRKESHDTMHVVDFHFVKGELYTLQKSVNSLQRKYLVHDESYTLIDAKSSLLYDDLMGFPLLQIKDSIFTYANEKIEFLMLYKEYRQKFHGYIGSYKDKSYFKNTYFYNLISEVSVQDKKEQMETFIDIFYDSSAMYYVSQNYLAMANLPPVYLYYNGFQKNAGKKYHKDKNTSIANLNTKTAQIFKTLNGSGGFIGMLGLLEQSRMDAYLLEAMLITFDFNRSEINYYLDDVRIKSAKIELGNLWYRNTLYTDEVRKKGYFLFLKNTKQVIIEIDYLTAAVTEIPLLSGIHGLYHWEVNDGRLYILKKETPTSWKRILYSYNINDVRIE